MTKCVGCNNDIRLSVCDDDTLELSKISSRFSCSRSFSETLLRSGKFDISTRGEILVGEDISVFSSRELVGRSVKSTIKEFLLLKEMMLEFLIFVYSKNSYTLESVSMSGRLHDNSSQLHPIELKFCTQNCLINISVEFEDKNDPSRNDRAIEKIVIIDETIPEREGGGGYRDFFSKKIFFSELFKTYMN